MKSIISGAVLATAIVACLSLNVEAKPTAHGTGVAVSDTGKMSKMSKGKMSKMDKKKMSDSKMSKKKMAKDTSHKM